MAEMAKKLKIPPEKFAPKVCPNCGSDNILLDRERYWFYCGDCGYVISKAFSVDMVTTFMPSPKEVAEYIVVDEFGGKHLFVPKDKVKVKVTWGPVEIVRADYLELKRKLKNGLTFIRTFKPTLESFLAPPEEGGFTLQNAVVTLRLFIWYYGWCEIHKMWERVRKPVVKRRIYPHIEVANFKRLLSLKKVKGYSITPIDGVKAYFICCHTGSKSQAAGFLNALSKKFPELKTTAEHVGETCSRLTREGWLTILPKFRAGRFVIDVEFNYHIPMDKAIKLIRSPTWWKE